MKVDLNTLFSVADVQRGFFPSRSTRWIKDTFAAGSYGPVVRDGYGWMISAAALAEYQRRHAVGLAVVPDRATQHANLKQFAG